MTPHKQLFRHKPEEGVIGDCWRTCIACLLDLHPSEVPHFTDGSWNDSAATTAKTRAWLRSRGLGFVELAYSGDLEAVMASLAANAPGAYYLLGGNSRTGCGHSVIACGSEIVWDPSQTDAGIVGPMDDGYYWATFFVPAALMRET